MEGAHLHAGDACRAGPQRLLRDGAAKERFRRCAVRFVDEVVAQVGDQQLRAQRQSRCIGRACRLAAAAFGARIEIEHILPSELLDRTNADRRMVEIGGWQRPLGLQAAENTLIAARIMWRCFEPGRYRRKPRMAQTCAQ